MYVDFERLKEKNIVRSRATLCRLQQRLGFPRGVKLGARRVWDWTEVTAWIDAQRVAEQGPLAVD
jgi:predicted DNA-binding transcriptional regulator AlpA